MADDRRLRYSDFQNDRNRVTREYDSVDRCRKDQTPLPDHERCVAMCFENDRVTTEAGKKLSIKMRCNRRRQLRNENGLVQYHCHEHAQLCGILSGIQHYYDDIKPYYDTNEIASIIRDHLNENFAPYTYQFLINSKKLSPLDFYVLVKSYMDNEELKEKIFQHIRYADVYEQLLAVFISKIEADIRTKKQTMCYLGVMDPGHTIAIHVAGYPYSKYKRLYLIEDKPVDVYMDVVELIRTHSNTLDEILNNPEVYIKYFTGYKDLVNESEKVLFRTIYYYLWNKLRDESLKDRYHRDKDISNHHKNNMREVFDFIVIDGQREGE
jgi:hypothetical protein